MSVPDPNLICSKYLQFIWCWFTRVYRILVPLKEQYTFGTILDYIVLLIWRIEYRFFLIFHHSKHIYPPDDSGEMTGSAVRSYVTVERPSGGKQIRKAKQANLGEPIS